MTKKQIRETLKRFARFLESYEDGKKSRQAKHRAIFAAGQFASAGVTISARTLEGVLQKRFAKGPKPATVALILAGLNALESTADTGRMPPAASTAT